MNNYTLTQHQDLEKSTYHHRLASTSLSAASQILLRASGSLSCLGASGTIIAAQTGRMLVGECQLCKDFLEAAQTATKRHIDAQSKLRMANMRFEREAIAALESLVEQTRRAREQAVARLQDHVATHEEEIGRSANG